VGHLSTSANRIRSLIVYFIFTPTLPTSCQGGFCLPAVAAAEKRGIQDVFNNLVAGAKSEFAQLKDAAQNVLNSHPELQQIFTQALPTLKQVGQAVLDGKSITDIEKLVLQQNPQITTAVNQACAFPLVQNVQIVKQACAAFQQVAASKRDLQSVISNVVGDVKAQFNNLKAVVQNFLSSHPELQAIFDKALPTLKQVGQAVLDGKSVTDIEKLVLQQNPEITTAVNQACAFPLVQNVQIVKQACAAFQQVATSKRDLSSILATVSGNLQAQWANLKDAALKVGADASPVLSQWKTNLDQLVQKGVADATPVLNQLKTNVDALIKNGVTAAGPAIADLKAKVDQLVKQGVSAASPVVAELKAKLDQLLHPAAPAAAPATPSKRNILDKVQGVIAKIEAKIQQLLGSIQQIAPAAAAAVAAPAPATPSKRNILDKVQGVIAKIEAKIQQLLGSIQQVVPAAAAAVAAPAPATPSKRNILDKVQGVIAKIEAKIQQLLGSLQQAAPAAAPPATASKRSLNDILAKVSSDFQAQLANLKQVAQKVRADVSPVVAQLKAKLDALVQQGEASAAPVIADLKAKLDQFLHPAAPVAAPAAAPAPSA